MSLLCSDVTYMLTDIDECLQYPCASNVYPNCDVTANPCTNIPGSFFCTCNDQLQGRQCNIARKYLILANTLS